MKFTKSWKRFWTMNRNHAGGFTLVELIVVIAILAILAGIAIPAYSGYINKAKEAGDYTLLSAINTAFAAACIENGQAAAGQSGVTITGYQKDSAAAIEVSVFNTEFQTYLGDSVNSNFEVIGSLMFDTAKGVFVNPLSVDGTVTGSYAGGTVVFNGAALSALGNSTFLNSATLGGSAGLLDKVDEVTGIAAGMAGNLNAVFTDPDFAATAMAALGVTTQEAYIAKQETMLADLMAKNEGMTRAEAEAVLGANAAVLYASQSAVTMNKEDLNALFSQDGIDLVKNNLTGGNTAEGMGQAALIYGMYTAYANSAEYGNETLQGNTSDPIAVLNSLKNDPNFQTYINSDQGQTDMDAYLGALGMINDSAASSPEAVEHLMVNGFNNQEMKDLIAGATGK